MVKIERKEKKVLNFHMDKELVEALSEFVKVEKVVGNIGKGVTISEVVELLVTEALKKELNNDEYKKQKEYYLQLQAKKEGHKAELNTMKNPKIDNIANMKKAG